MSSENAIGRAVRLLCPQTCSHDHENPNSTRLNTPDRVTDMKNDMTREPETLSDRSGSPSRRGSYNPPQVNALAAYLLRELPGVMNGGGRV
jgi:hypothetical protein